MSRSSRCATIVLLVVYGAGLCYLWFFLPSRLNSMTSEKSAKIIPLETTAEALNRALYAPRHRAYYRRDFLENVLGNFLLLAPLGLLLPRLTYWSPRAFFLTSLGLSLTAESIQLIFNLGHFDVDDLLLNVGGAMVGWWFSQKFFRSRADRT